MNKVQFFHRSLTMAKRNFLQRARESMKRGRQARRQPVPRPRLLFLEYLEQRTAPSCNPGVSGGVLRVNGDNGSNYVTLTHNNSTNLTRIEWYDTVAHARDFSDSSFSSILMNMGTAADDVTIDSSPPNRPVTVDGGGGLDHVFIGNSQGLPAIRSEVYVTNPPLGGYTYLVVNNSIDTAAHNVTLSDSGIRFDGGIPAIRYAQSDLQVLVLTGGKGATTYTVLNTPTSGFPAGVATYLYPYGFATVNVQATTGRLFIYDIASNNVLNVNVGNGGSVQAIRGAVSVAGTSNYITLNINDQLDPGDASGLRVPIIDTYTPAGETEYVRVSGLAPDGVPISTRCADTENVIVHTGINEVVAQVVSTGPLLGGLGVLTLEGNSDQTYVEVFGHDGTVQGIRGTLRITNPRARTALYVEDDSDTRHRHVNLDQIIIGNGLYGQISGLAPAFIQYKYGDILYLVVTTGTGGADVFVSSTDPPTFLGGNGPNTSIYLDVSLQHFQGPLRIDSNINGSITVDISDVLDPYSQTVTLDTYMPDTEHLRISGLTQQPIDIVSSSLQSLGIEGSGGSTFNVQTTSAYAFPTTIYTSYGNNTVVVHGTSTSPLSVYLAGGQNDTVNLGDADHGLARIQSAVTVVGNELGAGDTLNVIDQANPNPETYIFTDMLLVTPTRTIVGQMENFDTVVLYPSLDPATAVVDAHDPGLYTLVISYDAPPGAPPPGGGGGNAPRPNSGFMVDSPQIDSVSAHFLAETARKGSMAQKTAWPASEAMVLDLLNRTAKRSSSQQALATDLAWADALPALIAGPALA
jgi:hypothetical protein